MEFKDSRGSVAMWVMFGISLALGMAIATATILYTFNVTPEYTSRATLLLKPEKQAGEEKEALYSPKTYLEIARSKSVLIAVRERIRGEDQQMLMAPYRASELAHPLSMEEVLNANREARLAPDTEVMEIYYTHPDSVMAAKVANYFADELVNYQVKLDIEQSMRAVEDFRIRAEHQREKVEEAREQFNKLSGSDKELAAKEDYEAQRNLYREMMARLQEEMTKVALVEPALTILDTASPSFQPSKPNVVRNLSFGVGIPALVILAMLVAAIVCEVRKK